MALARALRFEQHVGTARDVDASRTISSTAATSSMKTPVLLIRAISFTPSALMTVVKTISTVPRITALMAKSYLPSPSP